uniref:Uncharacterized protein n=1 Tax=Triticum urartu TaxID=4572 RepID=A0A8R7R1Y8_TRIUA
MPSTSSLASSTFCVRDVMVGYMMAPSTDEWPSPSRWPISCTATDSRSTAASSAARDTSPPATHASDASRWNRPSVGEKACASVPSGPSNASPSPWSPEWNPMVMSASDADAVSVKLSVVAADQRAKALAKTLLSVARSMVVSVAAVMAYLRLFLERGHEGDPGK